MKVHIIHGINTKNPFDNVGKLASYFTSAGYTVVVHTYGRIHFWEPRFVNDNIALAIGANVAPEDVLVGHSNGCDIIRRIADNGVKFKGAILINPALNKDTKFANCIDWIHVYHNKKDSAVAISRLLLFHPWGAMGRDGYTGKDLRVHNINCYPSVKGHSAIFNQLDTWAPKIIKNMEYSNNG